MVKITQFGPDGATYDTDDYPYVLMNKTRDKVSGRFSTLEKAHKGRLMESLNNQNDMILLFNEKTKKFIDWQKKDKITYEKYKYNPDKYFDRFMKRVKYQ